MAIKLPSLVAAGLITPAVHDTITLVQAGDVAPLYSALVAKGWGPDAPNEKIEWGDQKHPNRVTQINNGGAAYNGATTALTVDSSAFTGVNRLIFCRATGEVMLCTVVNSGTQITVVRGFGAVAGAAGSVADDAFLVDIGPAMGELSTAPTERDYSPTKYDNYVQTHRKTISVSGRVERTKPMTGPERERQLNVAINEQLVDFEHMLLFGVKNTGTNDASGKRVTSCAGFFEGIVTNVDNVNGAMSQARLWQFAEMAFRYGSKEKLALAGSTAARAIHEIYGGKLTVTSGETAVGLKITRVQTPFGTLLLVNEPYLLGAQAGDLLAIDLPACELRATDGGRPQELRGIQAPDVDGKLDEVRAEFSLEYGPELFHARAKGITGGA